MSMTHQARQEIERLLQKGEKIGAIKHLKDAYGFSLEQSKILVEAIEGKIDAASANPYLNRVSSKLDEAAKAHVSNLLKSGNKIQAVKFVKETLRLRLKEAKDQVEELEKILQPGMTAKTSAIFNPVSVIRVVFGGVGAIMLAIAGYLVFAQSQSIANSELVTGRVVRMQATSDGMTAPVIEYQWNDKNWLHASTTYSSPPAYEVNEAVPIYVNRQDPTDITVDTFTDRWFLITILGSMGLGFGGIPLFVTWLTRRR
jgi:ribosomal protein L7/L12